MSVGLYITLEILCVRLMFWNTRALGVCHMCMQLDIIMSSTIGATYKQYGNCNK